MNSFLDVKKHADVGVLIAVVDSAHYTATCAEEGSTMYKLLLMVKNTQKQYVRISTPKEAEIWSTLVKGLAVKPAIDDTGRVMVPLEKASRSSSDDQTVQSVELIYIVKGNELGKRGFLHINFPAIDIPISRLYVSSFLPTNYNYGEFEGMTVIQYFTGAVPSAMTTTPSAPAPIMKKRAQRRNKALERREIEHNDDDDDYDMDSASDEDWIERRASISKSMKKEKRICR